MPIRHPYDGRASEHAAADVQEAQAMAPEGHSLSDAYHRPSASSSQADGAQCSQLVLPLAKSPRKVVS